MSDDLWELKQRLTKLSNEELIEMVTVAAKDYRQEAIDYATQELKYRHVDLSKLNSQDEEAIEESGCEPEAEAASVQPFVPIVREEMHLWRHVAARHVSGIKRIDDYLQRQPRGALCPRPGLHSMQPDISNCRF